MSIIQSYKDLNVWNKSIELVKHIYILTEKFPQKEIFGVTNQMRRSSVSIPSNIAEGQARKNTKEFVHFLHLSLGSLAELETQVIITQQINYMAIVDGNKIIDKITEIQKMIYGLIKSLTREKEECFVVSSHN